MKKTLALILTSLMCLCMFSGFTKAATDNSLNKVKKAGVITIGIDNTYPPMEYNDDSNKLTGYDIEMTAAIAKKMGLKVKYVPTAWSGIFLALQSKKFDLIQSAVSITTDRAKSMNFTKPYIFGGVAIFVKSDNKAINGPSDFKGKTVGCQLGTTGEDALKKVSGMKESKKYENMTEAFMDLKIGRLDAVVADPMVGDYYIKDLKDSIKKIPTLMSKEPIGAAFRKEDKTLEAAYQKTIDQLKKDGTLSKLSMKWFGYDVNK